MDPTKQQQMMALLGEYRAAEGPESWLNRETKRHHDNIDLFGAMIRKTYPDTTQVIAGHHIMFMRDDHPLPVEIASADTLIFDHEIAKAVWGEDWEAILCDLAGEPVLSRDARLRDLFLMRYPAATL